MFGARRFLSINTNVLNVHGVVYLYESKGIFPARKNTLAIDTSLPIMAAMKILSCKLTDGRRIPILFRLSANQPVLIPFLFVTLKRQYKAFNTIRNDLIAIKAFYEFHTLEAIDVDEALIGGQLSSLIKNIEKFIAWLSIDKKAQNIAGRIGRKELGTFHGIDPATRDGYLKSLKSFFIWCSHRYPCEEETYLQTSFASASSSIASRFDSYLVTPTTRQVNYKSLNDLEIAAIREFSHPSCLNNPFRHQNRNRNGLIIETFIETGIRIGELLLLTTTSMNKGRNSCYLSIVNRPNAGNDTRAKAPSLKTPQSQRTIGISESLYDRIQQYIIHDRRPRRNANPMKLDHGYLWVSERGKPLALNSVANIFSRLMIAIKKIHPDLLKSASPHSFRHTFAERFLQYLIEVKGIDMERAKDELRTICGWSHSSSMPQYYARRYIHNMANLHNKDRVESAWKRLSDAPFSSN